MKRRVFTEEFKIEAVEMCLQPGANKSAIARNLGVNLNNLYFWLREYNSKDSKVASSKGSLDSDKQFKHLEKENKRLALELEILKKAIGIFSKGLPGDTER